MYSKVYWIGCDPQQVDKMLEHYDAIMTPAIQSSGYHTGHHMIEAGSGKWLLVSNYHDQAAAEAAGPLVQELITPMVQKFGMTIDLITQGNVARSI